MDLLTIACSCGLDPATETMALQTGLALMLSTPFWFREQVASAARRLGIGRRATDSDECADSGDDEPLPR